MLESLVCERWGGWGWAPGPRGVWCSILRSIWAYRRCSKAHLDPLPVCNQEAGYASRLLCKYGAHEKQNGFIEYMV